MSSTHPPAPAPARGTLLQDGHRGTLSAFDTITPVSGATKHRPPPPAATDPRWSDPADPQRTSMFGAPPMFYDPDQAAVQDAADYQQWVSSYAQGGSFSNFVHAGGDVGPHHLTFPAQQQQQPQQQAQQLQHAPIIQQQQQNQYNFVQQHFIPDQGGFDQQFVQATAAAVGDRPQRALPNRQQRPATRAPVSYTPPLGVSADSPFPQLTYGQEASADGTYMYQPEVGQSSLPQQQYTFTEYQPPDQRAQPYTPGSDLNSFASSPGPSLYGTDDGQMHLAPDGRPSSQPAGQSFAASSAPPSRASPAQHAGRRADKMAARGAQKPRDRKRVRDSDSPSDEEEFAISVSMPPASGHDSLPTRLPGACKHCKKLKMKCDFPKGENTCRRCKGGNIPCIVEGRKPRNAPNKREYLLAQIRQKDVIIEKLLHELHNPYTATPLSIASYRTATSPSDQNNRNVIAWLDRLEASVAAAGRGGGEHAFSFEPRGGAGDDEDDSDEDADAEAGGARTERGSNGGGDDSGKDGDEKLQALPDATVPLGLLASLSLDNPKRRPRKKNAGRAGADSDDDDVGVANETYFMPGPAFDLSIRATLIENHSPPEILVHGLVTPDDVDKLFEIFYTKLNVHVTLLDREIHTVQATFARCPFLFTVVCAISSRYYKEKSEIYPIAMHFARRAAADGLLNGWKSVELSQAYILLSTYAVPARRWEEDRSWLYIGLAIRIATDLNLHQVSTIRPRNDRHRRELLNQERHWLNCHNLDRSMATQFGKPSTIKEDYIIRSSESWYKKSPLNHPWDLGLCAYTQLLRTMSRFHEEIYSDPNSPNGLNQSLDFRAVTLTHDEHLTRYFEEWTRRFKEETDLQDPACAFRASLLPFLTNYSRLVMYSFGFQQAYKRGIQPEDQLFLDNCFQSAKSVILSMVDTLCPSGYMRFSPDGHFIFASFASAFLLKLMRPEFKNLITAQQETEIFELIGRLIHTLSSPEIAIDDRHTPKLHARFLAGLLTKHRRDIATSGRIHPQHPPQAQVAQSQAQPGSADAGAGAFSAQAQAHASQTVFAAAPQAGFTDAGEDALADGAMVTEPVYQEETAYAAGTGPLEVYDFAAPGGQGYESLGALLALQNPAYWRDMMMPGYSWPDSPNANGNGGGNVYGMGMGMGMGISPGFGSMQTAEA